MNGTSLIGRQAENRRTHRRTPRRFLSGFEAVYRRLAFAAFLGCIWSMLPPALCAQDEDEDDAHPGLVAEYSAGGRSISRVDADVQFVWGPHSPDPRLPDGEFFGKWTGKILVRSEGKHAFHLYLSGEATVRIAGKTVAQGRRDATGWIEGEPTEIVLGEQPVEIEFKKTGAEAMLRLFWSSESFSTEPVPPQILFHEENRRDLESIQRGRDLYEALRCGACHRRDHDASVEPAPALANARAEIDRSWLKTWLLDPHEKVSSARMPGFGLSEGEVDAIVEFLRSKSAGLVRATTPPRQSDDDIRQGEILFRAIGCLACHTRGSEGTAALTGGGDLTHIGSKRTAEWIEHWLEEPRLNSDRRMPIFRLSDLERRRLALFLAGGESGRLHLDDGAGIVIKSGEEAGKELIEKARCAACHRIPETRFEPRGLPTLERPVADWTKSCLAAGPDPKHARPSYSLAEADRRALRAYVESRYGPLAAESPFARGERLLWQRGCLNCHARDGRQGIAAIAGRVARLDPDLAGKSEALVAPDLTAAGDKLRDEFLSLAIAGKQKSVRLPWLRVRMPRFEHSPSEADAIHAYLVGRDRIPERAPGSRHGDLGAAANNSQSLDDLRKAGRTLAGTRGFSCTACHKIAGHEPRNVALATRGSDLYLAGDRMRPEFFVRWTRAPLRIIPGMEMPSFERPVSGILEGRLERQLEALWAAFNDRSAPPKIDTSTIEQVLTVAPGQSPRIIRDVFNVGDALSPRFVARSFAVGFDNRLNVLFDLDSLAVRHIWHGDFARQLSSGKSWFWEPAVTLHPSPAADTPDVVLEAVRDATPILPRREFGRFGRLVAYRRDSIPQGQPDAGAAKAVRIEYVLTFDLPEGDCSLQIAESIFAINASDGANAAACRRVLSIGSVPAGYQALVRAQEGGDEKDRFQALSVDPQARRATGSVEYTLSDEALPAAAAVPQPATARIEPVTSLHGYDGVRLPLPGAIMPTAITWTADGTLAFCSLKGQVCLATDSDGDGIEDRLTLFEEGLAAPYGLIADGDDLIVAHKPELLRLRDTDGDGRADVREVVADGWGYTADYHDWTCGIVRDSHGNLYVGTGSDYANSGRERDQSRWRGKVLRIDNQGHVTPLGHAFRYPTGLAITPEDDIFVSDNQGVQNTFNEINHLVPGASYGVPSLFEEDRNRPTTLPAIQVPHPWTRSVNGLFFLPRDGAHDPFAGQGIGCEYDNRFLVRFSLQRVGATFQGAVYPFSRPTPANSRDGFSGTLCGAVSPRGDIYIGSIYDSGWLGGTNTGDIVRLRPNGKLPLGIREIRAAAGRFEIGFTGAIDKDAAARLVNYEITAYARKWQGAYATLDSNRHQLEVQSVDVAADRLSVVLHTAPQQAGYVYEITCGKIGPIEQPALWPSVGHYTMNQVPRN